MPLRLIFDTNDPTRQGVIVDYGLSGVTTVSDQVRNDRQLEVTIEPVTRNPAGSETLYSPDHEATDSYQIAGGLADGFPEDGTFTLTADGTSTTAALAYNISAGNLQTALYTIFGAESAIQPNVTQVTTGVFQLVGSSNGALATGFLTSNPTLLYPQSEVSIQEEDLGSVSTKYRLLLIIRQSPMVFSEPDTELPAAGVSVEAVSGSLVQRVVFTPNVYGGTFLVEITEGVIVETAVASPLMTAEQFAAVLTKHPSLFHNTPDEIDNFDVTKVGSDFVVTWTLSLTTPSIDVTDIDLVAPKGVSGVLNNNTIALYKYSRTITGDTFPILISVTRTRASGERRTIFGPTQIIYAKDIVDTSTMIPTGLPAYYTAAETDAVVAAALASYAKVKTAYKSASTSRASLAVPAADPDLIIPVGANEVCQFEFRVVVSVASATPDWLGGLTFPTGFVSAIWEYNSTDYDSSTYEPGELTNGNVTSIIVPIVSDTVIRFTGTLFNGATAGNITLKWSQNTSDASPTTVVLGSYALATKLN